MYQFKVHLLENTDLKILKYQEDRKIIRAVAWASGGCPRGEPHSVSRDPCRVGT